MLNKTTVQMMALGLIGSLAATSFAEDSALIDALVRKGVLKKGEAEQIRAQACKDCASGGGSGKVSLGESVSSLKLTGDVRLRYQYSNEQLNTPTALNNGSGQQKTGYGLRLRINADYKVDENFSAGFGLRTVPTAGGNLTGGQSQAHRSSQVDLGNAFGNYGIALNRAFIGWTPTPGITLVGGKQDNPFYTTDMVWSSEVNPAGFSQQIDLNKVFGFSGVELKLNSGQFIYSDANENNPNTSPLGNRDGFLWQNQLVATTEIAAGVKWTVAPGYLSTNGAGGGQNHQILLLPGDFSTELGGQKFKFLWDFAYNLDGANLANTNSGIVIVGNDSKKFAWLAGVQVGENKKKGDWSLEANYRQVGAGAVNPYLSDADFAFGDVNATGFKVGVTYNVGNATTIGASYYNVNNLLGKVGSVGTTAGDNTSQILQADVSVKF